MKVNKERNSLDMIEVNKIDFKNNPYSFIAPNGDVYFVEYMSHNDMACELLKKFYPNERTPYHKMSETSLLEKGWLRTCRAYYMRNEKEWYYIASTEPDALHLITDKQLEVVEKFSGRALQMLMDDIECAVWEKRVKGAYRRQQSEHC